MIITGSVTSGIVTEEQVTAAREAVETTTAEVRDLRRQSWAKPAHIKEALAEQTAAEEHLAGLLEQQQARAERLAERQSREQAAATDLDHWSSELDASRARLVDAVTAAEKAMLAALDQAAEHDALVASVRDGLVGHGLVVEPSENHETAAGERAGVWLRGRRWGSVDPSGVLARSAARIARAVLGAGHMTALQLTGAERGSHRRLPGDLFDGQADLPQTGHAARRFVPWSA
jgi:hypothetical protein